MSYRAMLARATESTDAPTPGYLYVDLAKSATGNPNACQEMANYLTSRLASKNNPNVKYKCCKVISKLCDQVPRNYFRRCVAQDPNGITAIKEAMQFRGTPDPVRGDEPNERVRQAAKECLDAVYREAPAEPPASSGGGYGGYAGPPSHAMANSYGPPPGAGGGGMQSRMQGIGNPRYQDPRLDPRHNEPQGFSSVVKEASEVIVGMIKDPLARNIAPDVPRQGHSGNLPGYGGPTYGRPPPGSAELSRRTEGQWTMASNRGPGAIQPDYQRDAAPAQPYAPGGGHSAHTGSVGGSWGSAPTPAVVHSHPGQSYSTPSITINSVPGASSGAGGTAASDGTFERNLILELCPPGGMKPAPPPDKLANFARTCASLNSDLVCPVLLDCLEEGQPWIIRAKALCTMEAAISNGMKPDGTNPYRDFFFACRDEISPLGAHPRSAIHEPARRVLALLGVSASSIPATATVASAPAPNLLDFDDEPPATVAQPPPSAAPPPPPETGVSAGNTMFGGMQVKSSVTPSQPNAPAAVSAASSNLLDFDSMVAPAPAPVPTGTDVFETSAAPAGAPPATMSSMFDQLSVKDAADKKESDVKAVVSNGSSAFGFMNAADASNGTAAPTQQSFDPLKNQTHNLTPNSAQKKMMEMSPEQIQAMAYQQMMMQQQQLQMQMMLQQQQMAGGAGVPMVPAMGGLPMYPPLAGGVMPRRTPSLGSPNAAMPNMMPASFSFAPKPAQKDDKKFDFVKDAMAGHKK